MQTAWDMVAPNIAQDDAITKAQGYNTVQENTEELYSVPKTADIEDTPVTKTHCHRSIVKQQRGKVWIFKNTASIFAA